MPGFYLPSSEEFDPGQDDFVSPFVTKERQYRHFDLPLSQSDRSRAYDFSHEDKPHRFYPLLGYTDVVRRISRDASGKVVKSVKKRPIKFASHSDAAYLQAYAAHLNQMYERALQADNTASSVLAYRKGGSTNVHHAKALFDEIVVRGDCEVFCVDIKGFFDSLDHLHLREELLSLVGRDRLSGHDWTVFNSMTRFSWVETDDLDRLLGRKRQRRGRVCSPADFNDHVRTRSKGLIITHDLDCGIPQGTPISGLYANIYMRSLDRRFTEMANAVGGSYRRYSDDIALILPGGVRKRHVVAIVEKVLADFHLTLSTEKTDYAKFEHGVLLGEKAIQYLGFTFDGSRTYIRPSSLDAYRRKMGVGIHAKLVAAKGRGIPSFNVFKRDLLSRYTHMGMGRNFIQYAYAASTIMGSDEIRLQVKDHLKWFNSAWDREVTRVYGGLVTSK